MQCTKTDTQLSLADLVERLRPFASQQQLDVMGRLADDPVKAKTLAHIKPQSLLIKPVKNLSGMTFGRTVVLCEFGLRSSNGTQMFAYLCKCGRTGITSGNNLTVGHTTSCGCMAREKASTGKLKLSEGMRFGLLVLRSQAGRANGCILWECTCDCGATTHIRSHSLRIGQKSCGCIVSESVGRSNEARATHGFSRVGNRRSEYVCWQSMLQRCHNPNHSHFHRYGGRGIMVCEQWADSFEAFLADMGEKPSPNLTIERINNDGHYEPGNCRWGTRKDQAMNKFNSIRIAVNGLVTVEEAAKSLGLTDPGIRNRVRRGSLQSVKVYPQ